MGTNFKDTKANLEQADQVLGDLERVLKEQVLSTPTSLPLNCQAVNSGYLTEGVLVIVTAIFKARGGKEVELRNELHVGASASWTESGVRGYNVHELIDQPGTFMNIEVFVDEAAFKAHLETPHVKAFLGKLDDLLAEPLRVYQGKALFKGENSKAAL